MTSTEKYPIGTRSECESLVREWGFRHIFTWSDAGNAYYAPHTHEGLTTHLIRRGTFTVAYPEDNKNGGQTQKQTFVAGARIDVPAGKLHEVWIGDEGCEYVIGE
ncbi:hypothetical protein N7456_000726 [Penicillium angulare]|uniref:Uncharacterized protein n=1 Tax=Penicillium angulare TaxID=116970 RepID=A0A9W9GE14_9EURO|nr:hypothetical protein N7456_000726 [Penicillium angulare]